MDTGTEAPIQEIQEAQAQEALPEDSRNTKERAVDEEIKRAALKKRGYTETPLGILGDRNITRALAAGQITEEQAEQLRVEDDEVQFNRRMYSIQQEEQILRHFGLDPEIAKGLGW